MAHYISAELRRFVFERANYRCEYCKIPQNIDTAKPEIEHIRAKQHSGETIEENLALSCSRCNRRKGTNIAGYDSVTGDITPIFNPRKQIWMQHFQIEETGEIESLTAEARVTAQILQFNNLDRIEERRGMIAEGIY